MSYVMAAQTNKDSITFKNLGLGNNHVIYEGEKVETWSELKSIMQPDHVASTVLGKAYRSRIGAVSLLGATLACFAAADYFVLANRKTDVAHNGLVIAGIGAFVLTIHFNVVAGRGQRAAIRMYNADVRKTAYRKIKTEYYFGFSGSGAGVGLRF